jgi:hypothetical protein
MAGDEPGDKRPLLVVARGQRSLLEAVRELFAELGGVDVIEDQGPSLLSREDRNDKPQGPCAAVGKRCHAVADGRAAFDHGGRSAMTIN